MNIIITNKDQIELNRILQEANKNYLKESRINHQPSFNILRILSAFRTLHPSSPPSIYNAIIYLTKIYNPQSLEEWMKAINDLVRHNSKKNLVSLNQTSKYMKTYQNSYNIERNNGSHFQSKSYAEIKIPYDISQDNSFDDVNKDMSQTNVETGKRQYYTRTDSILENDKKHRISFQPQSTSGIYPHSYYQKQNVNSTNIGQSRSGESALQYIEAIRRDLGRTDKSPIDQSFIKKIDNYESPYLNSIPTSDPEQEEMLERAKEFLQINLSLKAFSSLLANTLALQKAKQYRRKAEMQKRMTLLLKSFEILKENVVTQKIQRQKMEKASQHFETKITKNTISVLKLLRDLKANKKPFEVSKMNKAGFEFMLGMLLSIQDTQQTEFNLELKIWEFLEAKKVNKICQIIKYFGKNTWITQDSLYQLIEKYRMVQIRQVFQVLSHQKKTNQAYFSQRLYSLQKAAFQGLKSKWEAGKKNKILLMEIQFKRNEVLINKAMKGFKQVVYSTKLYSKRCIFLKKKSESQLREKILQIWKQRADEKIKKNENLQNNIKMGMLPMVIFLKKIGMRSLKQTNQDLCQKQEILFNYQTDGNKKVFLNCLLAMKQSQNKKKAMQQKLKYLSYFIPFQRWKRCSRKGKAVNIIDKVFKNIIFRVLVAPQLKSSLESFQHIQGQQQQMKMKVFSALCQWKIEQQSRFLDLQLKVNNKQMILFKNRLMNSLRINQLQSKRQRTIMKVNKNLIQIQQLLLNNKKQKFINNLLNTHNRALQEKQLSYNCQIYAYKIVFYRSFKNHRLNLDFKQKQQQINKKIRHIREVEFTIKMKDIIERINRKKNILRLIQRLLQRYSKQTTKNNTKADQFYRRKQFEHSVLALKIQSSLDKELSNYLSISRQPRITANLKTAFELMRVVKEQRNKVVHLQKYVFLRQLEQKHVFKVKKQCLGKNIVDNSLKKLFSKLCILGQNEVEAINLEEKIQTLLMKISLHRIMNRYVSSLMRKKHLYMAIKFRALKISNRVFTEWKKTNCKYELKLKNRQQNPRKNVDRLSTDFS